MLTIETTHLNIARALLERATREVRTRDVQEIARVVDLLYGSDPTDQDLGTVARVASWVDRNSLQAPPEVERVERGDAMVLDFLKALGRYLPDRIAISRRDEPTWFAFELPHVMMVLGSVPRVPPPNQWFIHSEQVNAILKTFSRTPTLDEVRTEARAWLRSEAYRIKLAATL